MPNENMGKYVASLGSSKKIPFHQPLHSKRNQNVKHLQIQEKRKDVISSFPRSIISVEFEDTVTRKTVSSQRPNYKRIDMVLKL